MRPLYYILFPTRLKIITEEGEETVWESEVIEDHWKSRFSRLDRAAAPMNSEQLGCLHRTVQDETSQNFRVTGEQKTEQDS